MSRFWNRLLWRCDRWRSANRMARCRQGRVRYRFDSHILIMGGGDATVEMLNAIATNREWAEKDVVVLSSQDADTVRDRLATGLSPEGCGLRTTVYHGVRTHEDELHSCNVEQASHIFIIGEDGEEGHDALNMECWGKVRALRMHAPQVAQCYMMLECAATVGLLHMLPQEAHTSVETTIVNRYEAMVQQLLMGDAPEKVRYTLDRGLVTAGADRYVHVVVVGMTRMGYAFATTVAQICHFPNYDEKVSRPLRTKITFIDPAADKKMSQFQCSHSTLFSLSHSRYIADNSSWLQARPEGRYGDFLDVEWEFVKGMTDEEWVREMLVDCATDSRQVLSVAYCTDSANDNLNQSLHLPPQFYGTLSGTEETEPLPNIYVYQPQSSALVRAAQAEVIHLRNLIPFGDRADGYDPLLVRQNTVAKRVNYLYQKETSGKQFVAMPSDVALLDAMWQQLSLTEKMSGILSATSVYAMLRGMGLQEVDASQPVEDPDKIEALARVEHSRRNIERLLAGFEAMPAAERDRVNAALESDDAEVRQEARTYANRNANQMFLLKDIAPYASLTDATKTDIRTIVSNLPLAALPHIASLVVK